MKPIFEKSRFANTNISPQRLFQRYPVGSNITTAQGLEKVMKSCSVLMGKNPMDTKLLEKGDFEDIDEVMGSDSVVTTGNDRLDDREQSNTDFEREIDISEIVNKSKSKLTKKQIIENTSFSSSRHNIYNPSFSSSSSTPSPPRIIGASPIDPTQNTLSILSRYSNIKILEQPSQGTIDHPGQLKKPSDFRTLLSDS